MGTRRALTRDIGHSGLNESYGIIREDFLPEWRDTQKKVAVITEMLDNSAAVGALRLAIELSIRDVQWQFVSNEGEDDPRLELLNEARDNLSHSWNDHIADALLMPFYGWSMFTIKYQRVGGRLLWRKFKMLGHDTVFRWQLDEDGGLVGLMQKPHLNPEPIPIERMVLYRFRKTKNNPEGYSILRPSYVSYYMAKNIMQIEAIGIERNLAGLPMVTPPVGADMSEGSKDLKRALEIVRNVRQDEQAGIVLPPPVGDGEHERWQFQLLSGGGQSKAIDTDMVISRYEKRILLSALAQFLMLGMDKVGALSTFEGGRDFFTIAVNSIADIIAETFTKYAIARLMELNGLDADGLRLEHTPAGDVNIDSLSIALERLSPLLTWTPADEVALRQMLRLPERTAEEITEEREQRQLAGLPPEARVAMGDDPAGQLPDGTLTEQQVLNGAQIGGAIDIIRAFSDGLFPRENAVFMVHRFFNIAEEVAERIVPQQPGGNINREQIGRDLDREQRLWARQQMRPAQYAAENAPDDDERRRHEGAWNRMFRDFLREQAERVARGAEELRA